MSSSSSSANNINALLKKTEHYDKDERYMATSDLCEVLKRHSSGGDGGGGGGGSSTSGGFTDATTERRICTAVLRLLHDKSNDVQAIAVKTLGVLLTTAKEEQVLEIADSLADQVLDASQAELRDVYAIGLRTLVKTIPSSMGDLTSQRLVGRLLDGIRTSSNEEIVLACLDILTDLLGRFGATAVSVTRQHEPILQMCLQQLGSASPVVRKRAGNTIGCLSVVLSDVLLVSMVERLLSQIDGSGGDTRALIRTMCTVSGAVGHRLQQPQIDRILPIFLKFTKPEDAVTGDDDDGDDDDGAAARSSDDDEDMMEDDAAIALANELRESCFMGFESFVLRCPTQVEPHLQKIIQAALAYMSYDPNYSYGDDDDDEQADDQGDEDFDDEYDDDDDYPEEDSEEDDDDDDESWKVRRSAIRALKAVVEAKKHDPSPLWIDQYTNRRGKSACVAMSLVGRFKEREENCRVGVLDCFTHLLAVTVKAADAGVVQFSKDESAPPVVEDDDAMDTNGASVTTIDLRSQYAPALVKSCEKLLSVKKGGERSKSNALALLSTLCEAPGGTGGQAEIVSVFKHIQTFLAGSNDYALHREATSKTLRLDALGLVHSMLACGNHDPVHVRKGLRQALLPQLCLALQEQWYKVIAQALRALAAVPRFFVIGYASDESEADRKTEMDEVSKQLFEAIEPLLAAHDVDQEIKECALTACSSLLGSLHGSLKTEQTTRLLTLLLERLKNETTRIAAIKTLSAIAASNQDIDQDKIDLSPILSDCIETMASFLKLQSRSLKQSSLEALDIVVTNHGVQDSTTLYSMVLQELCHLVVDSDLHISHLSL
jgi:cullin-associated NEDD8-dissociated protein 1